MVTSDQVVMTGTQLDTLCINTIRTLAIDAVQKANSGHPGAPMGLAPVAYCLWQEFLRYDPADPTWLNRDRFVLSNGHASMLLYAMLHLAEVRQVDEHGNVTRDLAVSMDDVKHFRQLGKPNAGTSGIAHHVGSRNDDRSAGTRCWQQCRNGDRLQMAGGELQQAGLRNFRFQRLRDVLGRRFDGRDRRRSGFAGRTPEAFESLLDVRPQLASRWMVRQVGLSAKTSRRDLSDTDGT